MGKEDQKNAGFLLWYILANFHKVADLSPIHFRKQSATDGTYKSKYWFPGFGFDSANFAVKKCLGCINFGDLLPNFEMEALLVMTVR